MPIKDDRRLEVANQCQPHAARQGEDAATCLCDQSTFAGQVELLCSMLEIDHSRPMGTSISDQVRRRRPPTSPHEAITQLSQGTIWMPLGHGLS